MEDVNNYISAMVIVTKQPDEESKITIQCSDDFRWVAQQHCYKVNCRILEALGEKVSDFKLTKKGLDTINLYVLKGMELCILKRLHEKYPQRDFDGEVKKALKTLDSNRYKFEISRASGSVFENPGLLCDKQYWLDSMDFTEYPVYVAYWQIDKVDSGFRSSAWSFHLSKEDFERFCKEMPQKFIWPRYGKEVTTSFSLESHYAKDINAVQRRIVLKSEHGVLFAIGSDNGDSVVWYKPKQSPDETK